MSSFLSQAFAVVQTKNNHHFYGNTLISDRFQLNSALQPFAILTFTNNYILLQLRSHNESFLLYALEANEMLAYRITSEKYAEQQNVRWHLFLSYNAHCLRLRVLGSTSADSWDNLLRKTVTKLGFHEEFKPVRRMGVGASATVFEVTRKRDNRKFAVKTFSKGNLNKNPKLREGLTNEIKILRILSEEGHENVLSLHEVYESQNSVYLVIDLCCGVLSSQLSKSLEKISENNKKHIITQLLKGLVHIHSKNIAHRDIKLENILFQGKSNQPQLIIGDFGLSTLIQEENYLFTSCGTPGFVAPEVILAKPNEKLSNANCDVFALGVIFHFLLTGRPLFQGSSFAEIYQNNKKLNFDLNHERYNALDQKALDLLKGMLKIDSKQRLTSKEALKHQYFVTEDLTFKMQSPAPTFLTNTYFQSSLQLPQIRLEGLQRQKQEYRKASQQ